MSLTNHLDIQHNESIFKNSQFPAHLVYLAAFTWFEFSCHALRIILYCYWKTEKNIKKKPPEKC